MAHVGVGGSKEDVVRSAGHVGSTGHDFVRSAGQEFVRSEEPNVGGVGGLQSSVGRGAGTGVRGNGGEEGRHGGMVAKFFHINMHRLLIEDVRCML